jgi:hypothetical protein
MTDTTIHTNEIATREADASTILEQIGRPALWAIGARNIVDLGDGVHFNVKPSLKVVVKLAANDTYSVEAVRINRRDWTFTSERFEELIYADQLQDAVLRAAGSDL